MKSIQPSTELVKVEHLHRHYKGARKLVRAINGVNFEIQENEFVVIYGPSGCGKSSLLNLLLGIDAPSQGKVFIDGQDLTDLTDDQRSILRTQKIGMVHQMPYWIKALTAVENVSIPLIIRGLKSHFALERAKEMLEYLDIASLGHYLPTQLSGGEQQKMSLARALVTNPRIILADELTGNLDSKSALEIMKILRALNKSDGRTIVLVTHNEDYWSYGSRQIEMKDGKIIKDKVNQPPRHG